MNSQQGFTLIELMVVVAIIAILAAIGINSYTQYMDDAKTARAYHENQESNRNASYSTAAAEVNAAMG